MDHQTQAPPRVKQDFSVGNTVTIGGAKYRVTGHKPAPRKGEAAIVELVTHDLARRYEWQPFRGLRVIGAPPKRIRKRRGKAREATTPQVVRVSLWSRMVRALRRH